MTAERLEAAIADHQAGRLEEAEAGYEAVLDENPRQPDANNLLAVLYCQRRQFDQVVTYARIVLSVRDTIPEYHNNLGLALKGLERFDEAAAAFGQAIERAPQYADALYNLGMIELDRRNYEAALMHLEACMAAAPHHAQVCNGLALALLRLGRPDEAIETLDQQFETRPNDIEALNNLCVAHTMRGEYATARGGGKRGRPSWRTGRYPAQPVAPDAVGRRFRPRIRRT